MRTISLKAGDTVQWCYAGGKQPRVSGSEPVDKRDFILHAVQFRVGSGFHDDSKAGTADKRALTDAFYAAGYRDGFQGHTSVEATGGDCIDAFREGNTFKSLAANKRTEHIIDAVGYADFFQACAAEEGIAHVRYAGREGNAVQGGTTVEGSVNVRYAGRDGNAFQGGTAFEGLEHFGQSVGKRYLFEAGAVDKCSINAPEALRQGYLL